MAQIAGILSMGILIVSGTQASPNYSDFFCLVTFFILRTSVGTLSFFTVKEIGEILACLIHPIRPP